MALGVNGLNQNIFAKPAETISGMELSKVAQELLSARMSSPLISSPTPSFNGINFGKSVDVSLFGSSASNDTNAIKFAATNNAGFELNLSQKTLEAVSSLNAKAANQAVNNIHQFRNGMIHINAEQPNFSGLKNAFIPSNPPEVFETMNLSKDRKGSSPFYIPNQKSKQKAEKEEGLNLIA